MATSDSSLFKRLLDYEQRSISHQPAGSGDAGAQSNWDGVVFRLGETRLTCPIEGVEEILPFPQPTPVPGAKDWLLGLANVRGNLVTIVDLGWFLFGTRTPLTARTRLILTRLQGRFVGLVVDEVFGQRHFHTDDLETDGEPPAGMEGLLGGRFPQGDEHWKVLRTDELMRRADFVDGAA